MKPGQSSTEVFFYGLAILVAAGLRFINLGSNPLGDVEASWALQALDASRGGHVLWGPQPGYILLTAGSFFIAGSTSFLARFWPALAGTLLALAPFLFREKLGRQAALIMAFGLALEPSLVAASRQADGRILAITATAFALGFFLRRNFALAGIAGGFALLGGPSVWNGLIALGLGLGAGQLFETQAAVGDTAKKIDWRQLAIWLAGTLVFIGTLFGFLPGGLSALGESPISYVQGWFTGGGAPILLMLVGWIVLSPLTLLYGLSGLLRAFFRRDALDESLLWMWVFFILIVLVYPARQTADLAWQAVPMLAIASRQVLRLPTLSQNRRTVIGYAILVGVLGLSISLNYLGLFGNLAQDLQALHWGGLLGTLFLLGASFLLIAWGWSWRVAINGLILGISAVLAIFWIATVWSAAGLGSRPEAELWNTGNYPKESSLTMKVIGDSSEWNTGRKDTLDLTVSGIDSPSLRWALRDYRQVNYLSQLPAEGKLSMVLTPESQATGLSLPAAYTGQKLEWGEQVNWSQLLPGDWFRWLFYRDLGGQAQLISRQSWILWVRSDLFPGATRSSGQQ